MARWMIQYPGAAPVGPIDAGELQAAWNRQQIPPNTMVCAEGFSQWVPFHSVAELVGAPPRAPAPPMAGASHPTPVFPMISAKTRLQVLVLVGLVCIVGAAIVLKLALPDRAEPDYDACVEAEKAQNLVGALDACTRAVRADPTTSSGKSAGAKLTELRPKYDAMLAQAKAKQVAEDAACLKWGTFCEATNRKMETFDTKVECESLRRELLPLECVDCRCLEREPVANSAVTRPDVSSEGMIAVSGGTFTMGGRNTTATIQPFLLDVTEVTADAYATCVKAGGCTADHPGQEGTLLRDGMSFNQSDLCNYGVGGRETHPMNCVSWDQATAYCGWNRKRLSTDEEWEWAARGQGRGTKYPWGNSEPSNELCWSGKGSGLREGKRRDSTCPVGSYPKGDAPGGIHDLAGNVSEWTTRVGVDDWPSIRGGYWAESDPASVSASLGRAKKHTDRTVGVGFRCAR